MTTQESTGPMVKDATLPLSSVAKLRSASSRYAISRQYKASQQQLEDSQLRLAKALDNAAKILGMDSLTPAQRGEVLSAKERFGDGLNAPQQCKYTSSAAGLRTSKSRAGNQDSMSTNSSKALSLELIALTRTCRQPTTHDEWDGRRLQSPKVRSAKHYRWTWSPGSDPTQKVDASMAIPAAQPHADEKRQSTLAGADARPWMHLYRPHQRGKNLQADIQTTSSSLLT